MSCRPDCCRFSRARCNTSESDIATADDIMADLVRATLPPSEHEGNCAYHSGGCSSQILLNQGRITGCKMEARHGLASKNTNTHPSGFGLCKTNRRWDRRHGIPAAFPVNLSDMCLPHLPPFAWACLYTSKALETQAFKVQPRKSFLKLPFS